MIDIRLIFVDEDDARQTATENVVAELDVKLSEKQEEYREQQTIYSLQLEEQHQADCSLASVKDEIESAEHGDNNLNLLNN